MTMTTKIADMLEKSALAASHLMPAGLAHKAGLAALNAMQGVRGGPCAGNPGPAPVSVMGIDLPGRIGLAAGFDKDARHLAALFAYAGFGFIEAGSVTPEPQSGNRHVFRMRRHYHFKGTDIENRCGLPSAGHTAVKTNLMEFKRHNPGRVVGISLAPQTGAPVSNAIAGFEAGLRAFKGVADYAVLNVSCPNEACNDAAHYDDADLIRQAAMLSGWAARNERASDLPVLIKAGRHDIQEAAMAVMDCRGTGIVVANSEPHDGMDSANDAGWARSGPSLLRSTLAGVAAVRNYWNKAGFAGVIIASGGIMSAADAAEAIECGADLVQVWSAFATAGRSRVQAMMDAASNPGS